MVAKFGSEVKSARAVHSLSRCRSTNKSLMANELILIIEDNEKNRKLMRHLLQVKGYQTIESETAEDGLKLADEKIPALILMDIQLSGMDGTTAMKQLKAGPKTKSIPIVAITAVYREGSREGILLTEKQAKRQAVKIVPAKVTPRPVILTGVTARE